jgi:conjugal transfer pilus assembly protein TraB
MKLMEKYNDLPSEQQTRTKRAVVIVVFITLAMLIYYGTGRDEKAPVVQEQEKDIRLSEGLLEDDITVKVDNKLGETQRLVGDQAKRITELEAQNAAVLEQLKKVNELLEAGEVIPPATKARQGPANPHSDSITFPPSPNTTTGGPSEFQIEVTMVGGIGHAVGVAKDVVDEKKQTTIRLPPGFMEGTLLTGIEADALSDASGEPEPIMIRIDSPTVLPNSLKADLKGCFVIASAHGKINRERVEARLVSLHCIRKNGFSAVEAELKGYVADQDGKKGMAGIVISKAGPLILRSSVAGAIVGAGDAISQGSSTTTVTGAGAVQTYDTDQIGKSAFGGGISRGSEELNKIFVEYIKQTTPIIEVGTNKIITVCITEPVTLKIVEHDQAVDI